MAQAEHFINSFDATQYRQIIHDDPGVSPRYMGVTNFPGATTADEEWAIQRITEVGNIITLAWARFNGSDDAAPQAFAWDDRATLTYG